MAQTPKSELTITLNVIGTQKKQKMILSNVDEEIPGTIEMSFTNGADTYTVEIEPLISALKAFSNISKI